MTWKQLAIVILGVVVAIYIAESFHKFLDSRVKEREMELVSAEKQEWLKTIRFLSERETERMKVLEAAFDRSIQVRDAYELVREPRELFLKQLPRGDWGEFQGVKIDGEVAQELAKNPRAHGYEEHIESVFQILRIDTRAAEGFRVTLRQIDTGEEFSALLEDLPENRSIKTTVHAAAMEKRNMQAVVYAIRRKRKISSARLTGASFEPQGWSTTIEVADKGI